MTILPYIALGVLAVVVIAMQIWQARSAGLAGKRAGLVRFLRIFNAVLLLGAVALVVYALVRW